MPPGGRKRRIGSGDLPFRAPLLLNDTCGIQCHRVARQRFICSGSVIVAAPSRAFHQRLNNPGCNASRQDAQLPLELCRTNDLIAGTFIGFVDRRVQICVMFAAIQRAARRSHPERNCARTCNTPVAFSLQHFPIKGVDMTRLFDRTIARLHELAKCASRWCCREIPYRAQNCRCMEGRKLVDGMPSHPGRTGLSGMTLNDRARFVPTLEHGWPRHEQPVHFPPGVRPNHVDRGTARSCRRPNDTPGSKVTALTRLRLGPKLPSRGGESHEASMEVRCVGMLPGRMVFIRVPNENGWNDYFDTFLVGEPKTPFDVMTRHVMV